VTFREKEESGGIQEEGGGAIAAVSSKRPPAKNKRYPSCLIVISMFYAFSHPCSSFD
jgi:hypothetical protein